MIQGPVVTALSPDLGIYNHHLRALVSYLKTVNHNLGATGRQNQALAALGSTLPHWLSSWQFAHKDGYMGILHGMVSLRGHKRLKAQLPKLTPASRKTPEEKVKV